MKLKQQRVRSYFQNPNPYYSFLGRCTENISSHEKGFLSTYLSISHLERKNLAYYPSTFIDLGSSERNVVLKDEIEELFSRMKRKF